MDFRKKINIVMFSMLTYADIMNGIVNRNAFVLNALQKNPLVNKILAVDFLHPRKKRALKDYYYGVLHPQYEYKKTYKTLWTRCSSVLPQEVSIRWMRANMQQEKNDEKLFVLSTVNQMRRKTLLLQELQHVIKMLGMEKNLIAWSFNPLYTDYFGTLSQKLNVFDTVDNWMTHSSHRDNRQRLHKNYKMIAERSDIIFTVSENLVNFYKEFGRTKDIVCIQNGVDLDFFAKRDLSTKRERQLKNIPRPILGYLGSITKDRVDVDLIAYVAKMNPEKSLVLAGPVWKEIRSEIHKKLSRYKNVYLLGRIPYIETAAVMDNFDVCLNIHKKSDFIRYTDPMKLYEYLALGKPVVSVENEGLEKFGKLIYTASSPKAFHDTIQQALDEKDTSFVKERKIWAAQNSYHVRVAQMLKYIERSLFT